MNHSRNVAQCLWQIIEKQGYAVNFTANDHEITVTLLIGRYIRRHLKARNEKEMMFLLRPYLLT